jgi:hypothetical protein
VENLWNEWVAATEKQITLGDDHKKGKGDSEEQKRKPRNRAAFV